MQIEVAEDTSLETGCPGWRFAVASGILGWVLDAFDFFVVVFLFDTLAARLSVPKSSIVLSISVTLCFTGSMSHTLAEGCFTGSGAGVLDRKIILGEDISTQNR